MQAGARVVAGRHVRRGGGLADVAARAVALEDEAARGQRRQGGLVRVGPRGLDEGFAVPVDADRFQVLDLALGGPGAFPVDVLDAQDETPPGRARPRPRENRGAQVAQVEVARGGGRESSGVRHAPSVRGWGRPSGSASPGAGGAGVQWGAW